MNKESNDIYYEVMMSDFVTLGRGHYERGNNASFEELNYQRDDVTAVGEMSLNDDHLTIKLQYKVEGLAGTFDYFLETSGFELLAETLQSDDASFETHIEKCLIDTVVVSAEGKTLQLKKDASDVLLVLC